MTFVAPLAGLVDVTDGWAWAHAVALKVRIKPRTKRRMEKRLDV
jgi:hypothetical protein